MEFDINLFLTNLSYLAASVVALTQLVIKFGTKAFDSSAFVQSVVKFIDSIKFISTWWKQALSWVVSYLTVTAASSWALIDLSGVVTVLYTILTGLIANGVFDFPLVQKILEIFKLKDKEVVA